LINESENKTFFWYINYGDLLITTESINQTISNITLKLCDGGTQSLNFTLYDEYNRTEINASIYPINFETSFNYWLGSGNVYKTYSFQTLSNSTNNSFQFCISPYNETGDFQTDMESVFSASEYSEGRYYLDNATLTNISSNITLYLLPTIESTKFYIDVLQGVSPFEYGIITISKFFVGEGEYKTTSIQETDGDGEFVVYLDLDATYQYAIVREGVLYATLEKKASCSSSPCEITLQFDDEQGNIFESYYETFASGTASNITFNPETKIVTYRFIDTTGLSNYFRLVVDKVSFNTTEGDTICDSYSYTSSGSITCNVSGYNGDFYARGYISRSPEILDKVLSFVIGSIQDDLGVYGALFCIAIIITVVMGVGAISRGNPATILIGFGLVILALKLMTILPLSWVTVSVIEIGVFILTKLTKT